MAVTGEQQAAIGASAMRKAFWRIIPLILASFRNPRILLLGFFGFQLIGIVTAINTICQIGAFVAPYGWGVAKDATDSFQPALINLAMLALLMAPPLLLARNQCAGARCRRQAQPEFLEDATSW
jgi:hypothetical protein